jgi:AraC family transcriptional regulator of adaptative response/methylated-DNA-[protein]-cysteine methyltransferase
MFRSPRRARHGEFESKVRSAKDLGGRYISRTMNASTRNEQLAAATLGDPRWAAVVARDSAADGRFYYSVASTGVYCRPSCAARRPRPENVRFHASREDAERSGFRPCKRCKPDRPSLYQEWAAKVARACRIIERSENLPSLHDLSRRAAISPYHFHRVFKRVTGLTPRGYAAAHREARVRDQLGRGSNVTAAIFDAGFSSTGRFYEKSNEILGMTPARYRSGGGGSEIRFAVGECSLGAILVAQSERGVCAILLGDDPGKLAQALQDRFPRARLLGGDAAFERLVARVVGFVEAPGIGLDLPLDVRGTAFQQRVWRALREIPVGETVSYTELARRLGEPKSVRAVAQACGANALAVAIPCHRVVRNDGGLSGYRWGVERKRALIERERRGKARRD